MPYDNEVAKLAPLESFDRRVFVGNSEYPQDLCDFILALALAYNDFHDVTLSRILFSEVAIPKQDAPSIELGQWAALRIFIIRVQVGFVRELLSLVHHSADLTAHRHSRKSSNPLARKGKRLGVLSTMLRWVGIQAAIWRSSW